MDEENSVYTSEHVLDFYIRSARPEDDEQLVKLIAETMPSNGMTLSFERFPSYIEASKAQYHHPDIKVVISRKEPDVIAGMMNLGWKNCFIDSEVRPLRYVADLRSHPSYRGQSVLRILMDYVSDEISHDVIFESIVLEDNVVARKILHEKRAGFPLPYHYDDIHTFTISAVKRPKAFEQYEFKELDQNSIEAANQFILKMSQYFNFLPQYNFSELLQGDHPFWNNLKIDDFYLLYDKEGDEVLGLYGLWDQKSFKRTRVVKYSAGLRILKPIYNAYARFAGLLRLPKENDVFEYLMMHSVLCHPDHADVFDSLLYHANQQMKLKNKHACCLTLAYKDPRIERMNRVKAHVIQAKHAFHSFSANPFQTFDQKKISYLESGRI